MRRGGCTGELYPSILEFLFFRPCGNLGGFGEGLRLEPWERLAFCLPPFPLGRRLTAPTIPAASMIASFQSFFPIKGMHIHPDPAGRHRAPSFPVRSSSANTAHPICSFLLELAVPERARGCTRLCWSEGYVSTRILKTRGKVNVG